MPKDQIAALRTLTIALTAVALAMLSPLWPPLVLAAWFADLVQPIVRRLEHFLGGKRRSAAAIVALLTLGLLAPVVFAGVALTAAVRDLFEQSRAALEGSGSLTGVLVGALDAHLSFEDWATLATKYGDNAWLAATTLARASANFVLGLFIFSFAFYTFVASGDRAYSWFERHLPIDARVMSRFAAAFRETGRGLIVGAGGAALAQGAVATAAFVALGIPRAFVLGALTAVCSFLPFIGTALVWAPLAIELALTHAPGRAVAVAIIGVALIGTVDNVLRPVLTRYGRLELPTFVLLIAFVGGIACFGPSGALLGPLVIRLAVEALAMAREQAIFGSQRPVDERSITSERSSVPAG
ncbi:MAG TPA: AI-2E family transporter [Labilithrix sp.]|nr:AI-2E family transporter [Labilithrix sp.]